MTAVYFLVSILIVAALVLAMMTMTRDGGKTLNVEKYRTRWLEIEQKLSRDDEASYQLVVLHADKLLDHALKERGTVGQTMGERMKRVNWSNADHVWRAHKLRNRIAHETDVVVTYSDAKQALAGLKQGLKDVGAI